MRFSLFLLANGLLFIRPSEFIEEMNAVEIYRYVIFACLVVSFPEVARQFTLRYPGVPPIIVCVLGLFPSVFLSGMFHGNIELIQDTTTEFLKVAVYFLLFLALVTDVRRLRQFLFAVALFSALVTTIAVIRYHSDVRKPPPTSAADPENKSALNGTYVVDEVRDPQTGEVTFVNRMCGTGIFNDPNDLALVLVTGMPLALYWLTDRARLFTRLLWLIVLFGFGYALLLTQSRGGFIALLAGLFTLFYLRFGSKKAILLGMVFLPVLFVAFAGRMTTISTQEETSQSRIQLWSDALLYFRESPLFGIGMDNYRQFSNRVAHNSYLHCYVELGLIGGTLFVGAFYMALRGLYELRERPERDEQRSGCADPELRRLYPYLMAMLVAYATGICFLSRSFVVPTYMFLALAVVYMRLHAEQTSAPIALWNRFLWPRLAGVSCSFLIASYSFVRLFVQWQ